MLKNLWEETIGTLRDYAITWDEVEYVILGDCCITKENFEEVARKTNYDAGYGSAEIRGDLMLVGWNWWLEREEYDGSEWWELQTKPHIPNEFQKITSLKNWEEDEQSSFFP